MTDRLTRLVAPSRRLRFLFLQPVAELVGRHVDDVIEFPGRFVRTIMMDTSGKISLNDGRFVLDHRDEIMKLGWDR